MSSSTQDLLTEDSPFATLATGGGKSLESSTSSTPSPLESDFSEDNKEECSASSSSSPTLGDHNGIAGAVQTLIAPAPTHDTSRTKYHMRDLGAFVSRLEKAAASIFPNKGRSRYDNVHVLLLRWEEDDMGVKDELDDLAKTFEFIYGFETETWLIPTVKSHFALMNKTLKVVEAFGEPDDLLIVYYAGHGLMNSSRQAIWSCTPDVKYASLKWHGIQTLFENADSDVLLLLDCCSAASGALTNGETTNVMETIAACGFETWAALPGRHSFTNTLNAVLKSWRHCPAFTAAMLHCEILNRLRHEKPEEFLNTKNFEFRKSPIHVISTNNPNAKSVELAPRRSHQNINQNSSVTPLSGRGTAGSKIAPPISDVQIDTSLNQVAYPQLPEPDLCNLHSTTKILTDGETAVPHVLISLALEEEQLLDFDQCRRWLQGFPALAKHATVEAIYRSNSTLLMLSVPVAVWDWIPENPACAFIGYVHSQNLLREPCPSTKSNSHPTEWPFVSSQAIDTTNKAPTATRTQPLRASFLRRSSVMDPEVAASLGMDKQQRASTELRYTSDSDTMASSRRTWNTTSTTRTSSDFYSDELWDIYRDNSRDSGFDEVKDPNLDWSKHDPMNHLKEKSAEIADLRARLENKDRMLAGLQSTARSRQSITRSRRTSASSRQSAARSRRSSARSWETADRDARASQTLAMLENKPSRPVSARAQQLIDKGPLSPVLAGGSTGNLSPKTRKRTKSVDEMEKMLDEMIQDRVESGQLIKGAKRSISIASERKHSVLVESIPVVDPENSMPLANETSALYADPILNKSIYFIPKVSSNSTPLNLGNACLCCTHTDSHYFRCPRHTLSYSKQTTQPRLSAELAVFEPPGNYICTSCQRNFVNKNEWRRHEESHDPQIYWTCMLGEPPILGNASTSTTEWTCVLCLVSMVKETDIVEHLVKQHKIYICTGKSVEERRFNRKDELKEHLQQVHALVDNSSHWEAWHTELPKKWAWGCGFCGGCSFTWEGRLIHIAEHFEIEGPKSLNWSHSLVVKGLLKQAYPDFNISEYWKEISGRDFSSDRSLEWSKEDAILLERKTQFHEGNPEAIAMEAYRLAIRFSLHSGSFGTEVLSHNLLSQKRSHPLISISPSDDVDQGADGNTSPNYEWPSDVF